MRHHVKSFRSADLHLLDQAEYESLFPPAARSVLDAASPIEVPVRKRKKGRSVRRKRRKLIPHDWAYILRESGRPYPQAVVQPSVSGSKKEVRDRLLQQADVGGSVCVGELRRIVERQMQLEERAEQDVREKRNNLIRATRKEIEKITVGRRKGPTKTEIAEARAARTLVIPLDDDLYEALYAKAIDSVPVRECADTTELLRPALDGAVDWVRFVPRHDQYSPFLEYALSRVDREFVQTNSASAWAYFVRLGEFAGQIEQYEYVAPD